MPQTKIVFFDIDGTLIDMQAKKITPKMLETLHRLQDRGIKICIATGRSPMVLPKIVLSKTRRRWGGRSVFLPGTAWRPTAPTPT